MDSKGYLGVGYGAAIFLVWQGSVGQNFPSPGPPSLPKLLFLATFPSSFYHWAAIENFPSKKPCLYEKQFALKALYYHDIAFANFVDTVMITNNKPQVCKLSLCFCCEVSVPEKYSNLSRKPDSFNYIRQFTLFVFLFSCPLDSWCVVHGDLSGDPSCW